MSDATTRVLTSHVPVALAEKVDELAARLDRSRGWIIRQARIAWIDQEEARSSVAAEMKATFDGWPESRKVRGG
ncbi:ribbon-helix-helix domain-containing protein [Paraburkholderia sp. MMS20-SJTR3]|uniref:Ribbon-helix-helix domain-containing protein n=1 Tax=Paraburkholderia sejongensis TaxID=2886946 RepID=A0ABS8K6A5_9BURK|nr:ribbon-helix-helix domain-containing protein [Paraburkholderia sp. MMS20-SJTR3]MCC8397686.1 ribbon-helix-helix domain-containing protein [Paraburkholderia sp. MMS20-SJTR3]